MCDRLIAQDLCSSPNRRLGANFEGVLFSLTAGAMLYIHSRLSSNLVLLVALSEVHSRNTHSSRIPPLASSLRSSDQEGNLTTRINLALPLSFIAEAHVNNHQSASRQRVGGRDPTLTPSVMSREGLRPLHHCKSDAPGQIHP